MAEENTNEEPIFKVADRRKFNADGSLREGVKLEEPKPQAETTAAAAGNAKEAAPQARPAETPRIITAETPTATAQTPEPEEVNEEDFDEQEIPDAENPSSFSSLILLLASQAAAALGMTENPAGGQMRVDPRAGKNFIDFLAMLKEKTAGNLHPQEQKFLQQLLGELQMQFVQIQQLLSEQKRRQEENLMKQAAQKFSGKDILGK
jgi:hypothetical protein